MPPLPVVSSSSSLPWLPQKPNSLSDCLPEDNSFSWNSHLDSHLLTQALTHQLSSSSSPKSLAKTLSHCLSTRPSWQTSRSPLACDIQQQKSQGESSNFSTSVSSFDLKDALSQPGSPFTTSCANSNSSMGENKLQNDGKALLMQHEIEDSKAFQLVNSPILASRAALSSLKLGDQRQAMVNNPSTTVLSAQASLGATTTKVHKRRSRAASKVPITILSADTTNFRAMVQKLTGIPTSPSANRSKFHLLGASEAPVLKPQPFRPPHSIQGLPTLDTSASLLANGTSTLTQNSGLLANDSYLQTFPSFSFLQSPHPHSDFDPNITADLGLIQGRTDANRNSFSPGSNSNLLGSGNNLGSSSISPPNLWYSEEADHLNDKLTDTSFNNPLANSDVESLLISNDRSNNYVDSWLTFDGSFTNHAFNMEPARIS